MLRGSVCLALVLSSAFGAAGALAPVDQAPAQQARGRSLLWQDPGAVDQLDFSAGPGGTVNAPTPPFSFVKDLSEGAQPKVMVKDGRGREWAVKWGKEVHSEPFVTRLVWASGFFAVPMYFVKEGRIRAMPSVSSSLSKYVLQEGVFQDARFALWDKQIMKGNGWAWSNNPFIGTRELNGLKVLVMLGSNWDTKDARDVNMGVNTAIAERPTATGTEYHYLVLDWGGSMGKWGNWPGRNKWDCKEYTEQTADFVKGVDRGEVKWGFDASHHTSDLADKIRVEDVAWLMRYLGRVTDSQIRTALTASGATPAEVACFAAAVRNRIEQLRRISSATTP